MLKDGSGWGAHAGIRAALLARDGFTGAPAVTVEATAYARIWADLGTRWRIREQYFKAYPVCRWAQPAIEAALALKRAHGFDAADVVALSHRIFREAIDLGSQCPAPARPPTMRSTACLMPVAAALVFDRVGARGRAPRSSRSARRAACWRRSMLAEDAEFSRALSAERWARLRIT